ncbi:DsbA family protein [Staphylococcus arlettae]|uniref:DsbA family protein n=1 Tax=Staphylococcus arlettae TaxID=29378 RepID=UPI0021D16909|nr:DsbA family protein [Staphylococcus arlettae]UXU51193.1 DsbA family protein [Staphylococcus arlettae]
MLKKRIVVPILLLIILLLIGCTYFFSKVGFQDTNPKKINDDTINSPVMGNTKASNTIIEFMDYKCPYCKKFHESHFQKIKNKYINNGKSNYKVVNASILGEDSIVASRAAHSLYLYYPKEYWKFHNRLLKLQPNNENKWITTKLLDRELSKLNIPPKVLNKIKKDYKSKNSKSWKLANNDKKLYDKYKNNYVPSIYVNGKFIDNPYDSSEIEKAMKNNY